MTKVRDTKAGQSVAAWVILKGKTPVAKVQAHYGPSRVQVDVWNLRAEPSALSGRASGYGYDKFTAALSGLVIDGHVMTDHCSRLGAPKPPRGRKTYPADAKPKRGYSFANFTRGDAVWPDTGERRFPDMDASEAGYRDCYRLDGLRYLEALGYTVVQAV